MKLLWNILERSSATKKIAASAADKKNAKIFVEARPTADNEESRAIDSQEEKISKKVVKNAAVAVVKKICEEATEETESIFTVEKLVEARKAAKVMEGTKEAVSVTLNVRKTMKATEATSAG